MQIEFKTRIQRLEWFPKEIAPMKPKRVAKFAEVFASYKIKNEQYSLSGLLSGNK